MSYLAIPPEIVRESLDDLTSGKLDDLSGRARAVGDGSPIDLTDFENAVGVIREALDERRADNKPAMDDDQFEGAMAAHLHLAVKSLGIEILDDSAFWAYVAAGPLWFFTRWREDPDKRNIETYHLYVDGTKADSCVPLRMFLRAQAIELDGDYSLASAIKAGTDFWRSHLIRVRAGGKKELARAIATEQRDDRMTVDPLRQYAKRINRRWSNQVIHVLDADDCEEIAKSEHP